jgi:dienelactone hydrolase
MERLVAHATPKRLHLRSLSRAANGRITAMSLLGNWTQGEHSFGGVSHPTYRKGTGPGVVVIHEIPGMTPEVIGFGEEVVAAGFTVVMPHLFGTPEAPMGAGSMLRTFPRVCISNEFTKLATGVTAPVAGWLRSLARELHDELGGPGVGALGMCFTGGFALAMMVDTSVAAPVLAQPSAPFAVSPKRSRDLNLSPADLAAVKERAAGGCQVLGLRYKQDMAVGKRFETLTSELGDAFIKVEFEGREHSTLTVHRQQEGVDRVLAFFEEKLR